MIQRDGHRISLWQDTSAPYKTLGEINNSFLYDVIIIGGGITGVTTALQLQEAGRNCLLIEAATLCFGTTGGTTAHLNTLVDTNYAVISKNFGRENARLVAKATTDAIALVRANISRYKIDCGFEEADGYLFAKNSEQAEELEKISEATREAGLDVKESDAIPVNIPFEKAIKVPGQAKFHPVKYVYALAKAFEDAGGVILQQCRVLGVNENNEAEVETTDGVFHGARVVYATHIPPGVNLIHLRCIPYRSYALAVRLAGNEYPKSLCYDMDDPYNYYRSQEINGEEYFIVGGKDHKTAHEANTEKCFLELEAHVRKHFNVEEVVNKWSSQYFEPADGLPYIGRLPGHTDLLYVASGFGGNGITFSQVAAAVLKNILLNQDDPNIQLFDPNRIKPVAGFKNFITHNADVAKQFLSKINAPEKLHELADIAPDEAKIVTYEGKKIALYKDEDGHLHALNPVCTHLKCMVEWNIAERSWDCPCHGARYSYDGAVLTGPATYQLQAYQIEELAHK